LLRAAASFSVNQDITLESVTLPISEGSPEPRLRVRLAEDAGGAPGLTLEVLSENEGVWPTIANPFSTTTTLASTVKPDLLQGVTYWLVTEPTELCALDSGGSRDYRWFHNTTGDLVTVRQQTSVDQLPEDPWPGSEATGSLAFRVEGATSEPNAVPSLSSWGLVLLAALLLAALSAVRRSRV